MKTLLFLIVVTLLAILAGILVFFQVEETEYAIVKLFGNPWRTKRSDWNPLDIHRGTSMAQRILDFLRMDQPTHKDHYRLWTVQELHRWILLAQQWQKT